MSARVRCVCRCRKPVRQGGFRLVVVLYFLLHQLVLMRLRQLHMERRILKTVPFLTHTGAMWVRPLGSRLQIDSLQLYHLRVLHTVDLGMRDHTLRVVNRQVPQRLSPAARRWRRQFNMECRPRVAAALSSRSLNLQQGSRRGRSFPDWKKAIKGSRRPTWTRTSFDRSPKQPFLLPRMD